MWLLYNCPGAGCEITGVLWSWNGYNFIIVFYCYYSEHNQLLMQQYFVTADGCDSTTLCTIDLLFHLPLQDVVYYIFTKDKNLIFCTQL